MAINFKLNVIYANKFLVSLKIKTNLSYILSQNFDRLENVQSQQIKIDK